MKKIALVALLISAFVTGVFARGKQPVAFENVPEDVKEEIQKNFLPADIQLITVKKVAPRRFEYAFKMNDETEIKYNNRGELIKVENDKGIKTLFVPEKMQKYVSETFPNATITKYEVALGKKVLELNDEMTLVFTKQGKFVRIED